MRQRWMNFRFWRETLVSRQSLQLDLLRKPKRVIYLYAQVPNRRLDLCVSEQELHCPQIPRLPIKLRYLGSTQRVSAKPPVVEPDVSDPPVDDASVLPGGDVSAPTSTAPEQVAIR